MSHDTYSAEKHKGLHKTQMTEVLPFKESQAEREDLFIIWYIPSPRYFILFFLFAQLWQALFC